MSWAKVFLKFVKGLFLGGIGSVLSNPAVLTGNDADKAATVSLAVGILSAISNWWKHKED